MGFNAFCYVKRTSCFHSIFKRITINLEQFKQSVLGLKLFGNFIMTGIILKFSLLTSLPSFPEESSFWKQYHPFSLPRQEHILQVFHKPFHLKTLHVFLWHRTEEEMRYIEWVSKRLWISWIFFVKKIGILVIIQSKIWTYLFQVEVSM